MEWKLKRLAVELLNYDLSDYAEDWPKNFSNTSLNKIRRHNYKLNRIANELIKIANNLED